MKLQATTRFIRGESLPDMGTRIQTEVEAQLGGTEDCVRDT